MYIHKYYIYIHTYINYIYIYIYIYTYTFIDTYMYIYKLYIYVYIYIYPVLNQSIFIGIQINPDAIYHVLTLALAHNRVNYSDLTALPGMMARYGSDCG